jgi:hypothetical protein
LTDRGHLADETRGLCRQIADERSLTPHYFIV